MQHPGRPLVGAEHPDRLARLHEHRLVVGQRRAGCGTWRRRRPRSGPPGRSRRRRPGRRAARPPPGSRLFCSIRKAASCGQPRHVSSGAAGRPDGRGPLIGRASPLVPRGSGPPDAGRRADASSGPTAAPDGGQQPTASTSRPLGRRRRLGRQPAVGSGPADDAPAARASAAPVPAAGAAGPAGRGRRAAHTSSTARMRRGWPRPRAACGPRPSPSTRGPPAWRWSAASRPRPGAASRRFSATMAAWV